MKTISKQKLEDIRKDPIRQDWYCITAMRVLSEPFIREFKDRIWWKYLSYHQTLSEPFIREFKDKVYWSSISSHQILSELFIFEFIDKLDIDHIIKYQTHLSIETKNKIKLIHKLKKQ